MSAVEEEGVRHGARGDGYRSPALDRLRHPARHTAPIRDIAGAGCDPESTPLADHPELTALQSRLERVEQQQLALATNLCDAHQAFMRLVERVGELARRLEVLAGDGQAPASP